MGAAGGLRAYRNLRHPRPSATQDMERLRRRRSSSLGSQAEQGGSAAHAAATINELPGLLRLFVITEDAGLCLFFEETCRKLQPVVVVLGSDERNIGSILQDLMRLWSSL